MREGCDEELKTTEGLNTHKLIRESRDSWGEQVNQI